MKKVIILGLFAASVSSAVLAAPTHENYVGSVDGFTGTIKNQNQFNNLIKYTSWDVQKNLKAAFADGELTAEEIKASGMSDHHFYQGYLGSATSQGEFDKYMKQLNGGQNTDNYLVSNRDLKASNSMVMNQVKAGNELQNAANQIANSKQDDRMDKVVSGLKDLGAYIESAPTPTPPVEGGNGSYDDTAIKGQVNTNTGNITTNTNNIQQVGAAVDKIAGSVTTNTGNIEKNSHNIGLITNYLKATAAETAAEIARLDGRIDSLEKKTDKMKAGIAGSTAIASLTQYTGNGTHHIAVGIGGYDGASALAGGYTYAISVNTTIRGTVAYDSEGEFGFGASVGHSW